MGSLLALLAVPTMAVKLTVHWSQQCLVTMLLVRNVNDKRSGAVVEDKLPPCAA